MNTRIKQLRKHLEFTQAEFGDCLGVSPHTISSYESGKSKPIKPVLILICREFNVCEDWLLSGTGAMFLPDGESALDILARRYHLRVKDYMLIKKLLDMGSFARDEIYDYMYDVVKAVKNEDVDPNAPAFSSIISDQ